VHGLREAEEQHHARADLDREPRGELGQVAGKAEALRRDVVHAGQRRRPEEQRGQPDEGREREKVQPRVAAAPREPEADSHEVVCVHERELGGPAQEERRQDRRRRGREHHPAAPQCAFGGHRCAGQGGERDAQVREKRAHEERHAHRDHERGAAVPARPHDAVAHVREQVRHAEHDGAERERPQRRTDGERECQRDGEGADHRDAKLATGREHARDGHEPPQEARAQQIERGDRSDGPARDRRGVDRSRAHAPGERGRVHDASAFFSGAQPPSARRSSRRTVCSSSSVTRVTSPKRAIASMSSRRASATIATMSGRFAASS
jgi:hypothetical protein